MMRTSAAKIFLLNLMVLVAACTAAVEPSADRGVREAGAEVLFWSQQQRDANFRQMERLFPASRVAAGGSPRRLAQGASLLSALGGEAAVQALMARLNVAGLLILQNGQIRLERYGRGFSPEQRWT